MDEIFFAWKRPLLADLGIADTYAAGRLKGGLTVTLDDGGGPPREGTADFLFAGPQDVRRLVAGVVVGRQPSPGTRNAEITRVAHVELRDDGLPWRYSPFANAPALDPWLVLVVGVTGQEVFLDRDEVRLLEPALKEHRLDQARNWAHLHDIPGQSLARILSPRQLVIDTDYTAVLVPAWMPGEGASRPTPAWDDGTPEVTLPCYDHWQFRTRDDTDDFASIAQRLDPLTTAEEQQLEAAGFGRAAVTVRERPAPVLHLGGALTAVDNPPPEALTDVLAAEVETLAALSESAGRWVLGLPRYDEPWTAPGTPVPADGWRRRLRVDPRHRGSAGLGAWAAIAWQDRIAAAAAQQAGALAALAERVRHLSLGLRAVRSQWDRRLPADPVTAFAVLAPMLARLPVPGGVAQDRIAGRTSRLVPALFSSGARRLLRPRTALARAARPGATALPGVIAAAATRCVPPPEPLPGQERLTELVDPDLREETAGRLRQAGSDFLGQALAAMPQGSQEDPGSLGRLLDQVADELVDRLGRPPFVPGCAPVADLGALAGSVLAGIDPRVARPGVVGRVLDGITGVRQPELAAPDVALELDIPLWSFLKESSPDWLLPGGGDLPVDRVTAMQTNPEFVDAFLVGANQRTLGELRWRNLPLVTGWTPLRRFWQRIGDDGGGPATDISNVLDVLTPPSPGRPLWTDDSVLGAASHQRDGQGARLVVVLHTELFRRYPSTLVYLMENPGGTADWTADVKTMNTHRVWPNLNGDLHPELVYFGFPVPPEAGRNHWLVLEEPPPGYRFTVPTEMQKGMVNAAEYARATLDVPVRAFFGQLLS